VQGESAFRRAQNHKSSGHNIEQHTEGKKSKYGFAKNPFALLGNNSHRISRQSKNYHSSSNSKQDIHKLIFTALKIKENAVSHKPSPFDSAQGDGQTERSRSLFSQSEKTMNNSDD
jgi:hypothetical protein